MNKKDYYEVLGVSKSSTDKEIKSAFRRLAKQYHPDVNKEEGAEAKFKEIQEAYAVLSDEQRRSQYDQFGHAAFEQGAGGGYGGGFDFSGFDFSDIFGDLFGGGFGFGSSKGNRKQKGRDKIIRMDITFDEAVYGCKKTIKLNLDTTCEKCDGDGGFDAKTCDTCHGSGSVSQEQRTLFGTYIAKATCSKCGGVGKTYEKQCSECRGTGTVKKLKEIDVTVPAGVNTGNQLRLAGKGEAGYNGEPNGDIYLEFNVLNHQIFEREEDDIYLELPITITEAIIGCKKVVPTLYGDITLNIPAGSSTNDKHRLRGKGAENLSYHKKGDMYIILNVIIPNKLDREQKKLIEKLSSTKLDNSNEFKKFNTYMKNKKS